MRTIPVRDEMIPKETGCSKNLFFPIQHTRRVGGGKISNDFRYRELRIK